MKKEACCLKEVQGPCGNKIEYDYEGNNLIKLTIREDKAMGDSVAYDYGYGQESRPP